jgi:hypothetical protein
VESSTPIRYLLVFDGPASEERISRSVMPTSPRWYCRSGELGSDESATWWTFEEPPEDESVEVTEYRHNLTRPVRQEDDETVMEYTCDSEQWVMPSENPIEEQIRAAIEANPELAKTLEEIGEQYGDRLIEAQKAQPESIPRASFAAEDIAAILVNGTWFEIPTPGKMLEVVLEPEGSTVSLSIGPNLIYEQDGEYVSLSPQAVHGFRFRPSSIGHTLEVTGDVVRVGRDLYELADENVLQACAQAEAVYVVEPNGEHTQVKSGGEDGG